MKSPRTSKVSHFKLESTMLKIGWFLGITIGFVFATVSWAAQVSPSALSFSASQGGANPDPQIITYSKNGKGRKSWSTSADTAWVSVTPLSGTIADEAVSITIRVNTTGLAAGTYSATVQIKMQGQKPQEYTTLPISVTITGESSATSPIIGLSSTSLTFSGVAGGPNPAEQSIGISNVGGGTLSWMTSDNAVWLTPTPVSGTNSGTVSVAVNVSGLAAGTYSGSVTISAPGASTKSVPVTLVLSAPTASTAFLSWSANTESDLAGYKIYRGTASGSYGSPIAVVEKGTTSYNVSALQSGTTYFFAITAFDVSGNESPYSNEVSKSIY